MQWSPTRREFLRATGLVGPSAGLGGSAAGVGAPTPAGLDGSPVGFGNASWDNATDAVPDHPFAPSAAVEWSVDVDGARPSLRRSETDGAVYVATAAGVRRFSTDGTEQWRRSVESVDPDRPVELHPGPGAVYVEGRTGLHALDADDGRTRWRHVGEDSRVGGHVDVSLVTPETVFLHESGVTALAATDGSERWQFEPDDPLWFRPAFADGTFYAGTIRGDLYALSAEDGSVRWRADHSAGDTPRFEVAGTTDDAVLAWDADLGGLYGFDAADGSLRWRFDADTDSTGFPGEVRDGVAYVGDGPLVRALSVADGTERWRYDAGGALIGWPRFDGDTGYFGSTGTVHAVSTADGTERWRFAAGSGEQTYVAGVLGGTVVAHSDADVVYGLDGEQGRLRWQFDHAEDATWFTQVGDDAAYVATESGTVYALSSPGSTPLYDAYRTVASPAGLAVGGLLGAAAVAGAYRRRRSDETDSDGASEPTEFADFERLDARAEGDGRDDDARTGTAAAEVYDARTPADERVVLQQFGSNAVPAERFASAVGTWADIDVRGVLDVVAWGTDPAPWVATERADATLAERAPDLGTAELGRALADAAETLHRAHREGVVHGGPAPETVWFADGEVGDGETDDEVLVGGWRLAACRGGSPVGPPEPDADPEAADTYRLAVMADDLLGDGSADEEPPDDLREVLSTALADDPADRYDSALKFADALRWAVRE